VRRLTDRELGQELIAFFGTTTTARLLGWCALTLLTLPSGAEPTERTLLQHGWGSVAARYRNVNHLKAFKAHLDELGVTVDEADVPEGSPLRIVAEAVA